MSRREYNWDAIAAVIAALIGLLAIIVSGYTAWNVRQQTRAQVWPHLQLAWSVSQRGILALNPGAGPAIVRSVLVRVDGKPQPDWSAVKKALGLADKKIEYGQSTLNGAVLSPGETLPILVIPDRAQFELFSKPARQRVSILACFCSTLGDCWQSSLGGRDAAGQQHSGLESTGCVHVNPSDEFAE